MTMDRAWLLIFKIWNMLCQLSSSHDNDQSMVISPYMNYAPSVVIISWQWSSHGFLYLRHETCSDGCHRLITTLRAWWYPHKVWNMLLHLSSSKAMVTAWSFIPKVWTMLLQLSSSYGDNPLRYELFSVSCHHLMWTFRAWWYPPSGMKHATSVVIVSWQRSGYGDTTSDMKYAQSVLSSSDNGQIELSLIGHLVYRYIGRKYRDISIHINMLMIFFKMFKIQLEYIPIIVLLRFLYTSDLKKIYKTSSPFLITIYQQTFTVFAVCFVWKWKIGTFPIRNPEYWQIQNLLCF